MARPPADLLTLVRRHRMIDVARALLGFAGMRMKDTQLQEVASSMTLTTLLSLIPLLAVSLAAFAAFPSFAVYRQELEAMVFNSFLPPQESVTIVEYIRQFSAHASGLGIFGLAGLQKLLPSHSPGQQTIHFPVRNHLPLFTGRLRIFYGVHKNMCVFISHSF